MKLLGVDPCDAGRPRLGRRFGNIAGDILFLLPNVDLPSHPHGLPHHRHQQVAVAQQALCAALTILHRHGGDAAVRS